MVMYGELVELFFTLPLTKGLRSKALYFEIFRLGVFEEFVGDKHPCHVFSVFCGAAADLRFVEKLAENNLLQWLLEPPGFPGFHDLYLVFEGDDQFPKREAIGSCKRFFASFADGKREIFLNLAAGGHKSFQLLHFLGRLRLTPFDISVTIGKHRSQNFQCLWSDIAATLVFLIDIKVVNFSGTSSADETAKGSDVELVTLFISFRLKLCRCHT